ncbi:MAG TPA: cupin domain-containing protein [Vicinamibacteria bacterium]
MAFPTPEFWARFSEDHWENAPLVLRRPFPEPFATPARVWGALVAACERFRAGESVRLRLFGEQGLVVADLDRLLPDARDGCFTGYAARLARDPAWPAFTLVANYVHVHDHDLWLWARQFLSGLYARVGIPAHHADVDVFVSNRRRTPFGIHRDPASNFTFVLEGRKTMRLWPQDAFARRPRMDAEGDAGYGEQTLTLEGEAGDVLYWPSSYWHVADSTGELSATLNVSLYLDATADAPGFPGLDLVSQRARAIVGRRLRGRRPPATCEAGPLGAAGLPEAIGQVLEAYEQIGREGALARDVIGVWLARLSAGGFDKVPPPLPAAPLQDRDEVWLDPAFPILCRPIGGEVALSAQGRTVFWPRASAALVALVDRLNRGERVEVGRLLRELTSSRAAVAAFKSLLEMLASWRCLQRASSPSLRGEREDALPSLCGADRGASTDHVHARL